MPRVKQLKSGSYVVEWSIHLEEFGRHNIKGSSRFKCSSNAPMFFIDYSYARVSSSTLNGMFNFKMETTKDEFRPEHMPATVHAIFNGQVKEVPRFRDGIWQTSWRFAPRLAVVDEDEYEMRYDLVLMLDFLVGGEKRIINHLSKLMDSQEMSDITLVVQGKEMKAHTAIMISASPVLAAMFKPGLFKEAISSKVEIDDVEPEVFDQVIRYAYTGIAPKLEHDAITESLFVAADKYQIEGLKEACEKRLAETLHLDNVVRFLVIAHLHSSPMLQEEAVQCIIRHKVEIWQRAEWKEMTDSYKDLFYEVSRRICSHRRRRSSDSD